MKAGKFVRWVLMALAAVASLAGGVLLYLTLKPPKMAPASAIRVEVSPERIERGRYLARHVMDCFDCHSERDFTRFGGPVVKGAEGKGMGVMPLAGLPGTVVVPNLTPDPDSGLGRWTDGEIIRAIREGVDKDGQTLFPLMPYPGYREMSDEDVQAIVAYLRTLPPIKTAWPKTKIDFPVNLLIKGAPQPGGSVPPPNRADKVAYGRYLVTVANCEECHTQFVKGELARDQLLAGGRLFAFPAGTVYSANLTPDPDTGLGKWTEEYFIHKFRSYTPYAEGESPLVGKESFTLMPWLAFSQMNDEDLSAIYAYLRTVKPISNAVEKHQILEAPLERSFGGRPSQP
jgi:mono/diheme cytochrome c family protein